MNLWKEREGGCGKRETGSGQRDVVWGRESMGESVGYREVEAVSVNRRLSPREGNQQGIVWLL